MNPLERTRETGVATTPGVEAKKTDHLPVNGNVRKLPSPANQMLARDRGTSASDKAFARSTAQDFPHLPANGTKVRFHEDGWAWKTCNGSVTVETKLGPPDVRKNFEGYLTAGALIGAKFYERAHAQGPGTGVESPYGIALAPKLVNQELQNRGIEDQIREIQRQKRDDVDLFLRSEVSTTDDGMFLTGINYQLYAQRHGESRRMIYAASIEIEGLRSTSKCIIDAQPMNWLGLDSYLKGPAEIEPHHPRKA
jgi:hypothetical protein